MSNTTKLHSGFVVTRYECWNPHCYSYAGYGIRLNSDDVEIVASDLVFCKDCGRRVAPQGDIQVRILFICLVVIFVLISLAISVDLLVKSR